MKFCKMQGAGNDFILLDNRDGVIALEAMGALAKQLCARRFSVGADGLMFVQRAQGEGDFAMLFYNADGSLGEMCGNGARCLARYGYEKGLAGETQRIETTAGLVVGRRLAPSLYELRLNDPTVCELHRRAEALGRVWDCGYVELGAPAIPHAVVLLEDMDTWPEEELRALGRALRHGESFPKGANVSFVKPLGGERFKARTYERGVEDFTLACGTGCGAIAAVICLRGLASGTDTRIDMPGGTLSVRLSPQPSPHDLFLTGPAVMVCEGELLEG